MEDRKKREVRSNFDKKFSKRENRDKQLTSIRNKQNMEYENNLNIFDFLFTFGELC